MTKTYLGDGVYAEFDGHGVVLTTEDGVRETNRIVLEPEVYAAFTLWALHVQMQEAPHNDDCLCDACARTEGTYAYKLIHD